jgi:hypothetical protein
VQEFLPGTKVHARGLKWEVVFTEALGPQTLVRLRGLESAVRGAELNLLMLDGSEIESDFEGPWTEKVDDLEVRKADLTFIDTSIGGTVTRAAEDIHLVARKAVYIDGASFHFGANLRRDRYIRDRLRNGDPPWRIEELRAKDLQKGEELGRALKND